MSNKPTKKDYNKIILKDNHFINGKIIPKGYVIITRK
jgi:hypothetical protein